jgi:hypothetical protein
MGVSEDVKANGVERAPFVPTPPEILPPTTERLSWFGKMRRGLGRLIAGRKSWTEPPFWDLDRFRIGLGMGSTPDKVRIENDVVGYSEMAYKRDGIVFACAAKRQAIFSEARFQWRTFTKGRPGPLFGDSSLSLLEKPWPGGTTGDLLSRMDMYDTVAGNFYATKADNAGRLGRRARGPGLRISILQPQWITIIIHSASEDPYAADAHIVGYLYEPLLTAGRSARAEPVLLLPDEMCHYAPKPDPSAPWRGMSWLTPVLSEISADQAATKHKLKFFENGATLSAVATLPKEVGPPEFKEFVEAFKESHQGSGNAYKTLFLGGGADITLIGADLKQIDFKVTQGAGETRIAAASEMHPVIVGLSEGLSGSSLNAGNFGAARRATADTFFRPRWRIAAASLQPLVEPPRGSPTSAGSGAQLWYDDREIAFCREDAGDQAEIQAKQAQALRALLDAGYEPDAAVAYLDTNDLSVLIGKHSGLFSVQLQPPGTTQPDPTTTDPAPVPPALNGRTNGHQAALAR